MTYTATFYPISRFLSEAHQDDLEIKNQMCWVRKMINRVPKKLDSEHEVKIYTKLIQDKLLKPSIKYRATLPLVALLFFKIEIAAANSTDLKTYNSIHFWINHYTEEIGSRKYNIWSWPHSRYIQFEYGLIENNWRKLVDSTVISF